LGDTTTLSGSEYVDFMARSSVFNSDLGGMRVQRRTDSVFNGNIDTIFLPARNGNLASEMMRVRGDGTVIIGAGAVNASFGTCCTVGGLITTGPAIIGYEAGHH